MLQDTLDVRAIFFLRCPDMEKLVERLQRRALRENRLDDANLRIIRSRLKTYERETKPLLRFYGRKLVHEIDSTQAPAQVLAEKDSAAFLLALFVAAYASTRPRGLDVVRPRRDPA